MAGAGDVTGDNRADLLLGAPASSAAYLVYGSAATAPVDLAAPRDRAVEFTGAAGDRMGFSVAGVGDVTGDGRPDFAVGAPGRGSGRQGGRRLGVRRDRSSDPATSASSARTAPTCAAAASTAALTKAEAQAEEVQEGLPPGARQMQEEAEVARASAVARCR